MVVTSVIENLNSDEREFIVDNIPAQEIRTYFVKNPNPFQKIVKGFQAKKLPDKRARSIVLDNLSKPFIQEFVDNWIAKWLKQIREDCTSNLPDYDEFQAELFAVSKSVFANNIDLYFKLGNDNATNDDIQRFKAEMGLFTEKKQLEVALEEKTNDYENKLLELSGIIEQLNRSLKEEKELRETAERSLSNADAQINVLTSELAQAKDSVAAKTSKMQDELARLKMLSRYADVESENDNSEGFQYTSICSVWYDDKEQPQLSRIADIKDGIISLFHMNSTQPGYFGNREHLFWMDGPSEDGTIGVWNWNATLRNTDPTKDHIVTSYNKYAGLIEVIELMSHTTFAEAAEYILSMTIPAFTDRRVLFVMPSINGKMIGLLCSEKNFNMQNGKATLKSNVFILPQFTINTADIITIDDRKFYNHCKLGMPDNLYRIKQPKDVVKELLIKRASSAVLRQRGLNQREAQHCQGFLKDICTDTLYSEIADVYACTDDEAREYVAEFIAHANTCLTDGDLDLNILSEAVSNNPELMKKCKDDIKAEWESENYEMVQSAKIQLEDKQKSVAEINELYKSYESKLHELEAKIAKKESLVSEVEKKIADKIACAKQNAADFISEMAFTMPSVSPAMQILVTNRKIQLKPSNEIIDDADTFEECLEENLNLAGYNKDYAFHMSQTLSYCIFNNLPIVVNENADRIADCISAMFGTSGAYAAALPIGENNCVQIIQLIKEKSELEKSVFLIDGIFDGFSLNKFNELMQHSYELQNAILVLALNGVQAEALPISVWKRTMYLDGDIGIRGKYKHSLNSYSSKNIGYKEAEDDIIKICRKNLKPFSCIIGNTAMVNYVSFMSSVGGTIDDNITVQLQLMLSAKASGKEDKLNEILDEIGITLNAAIKDKYS